MLKKKYKNSIDFFIGVSEKLLLLKKGIWLLEEDVKGEYLA